MNQIELESELERLSGLLDSAKRLETHNPLEEFLKTRRSIEIEFKMSEVSRKLEKVLG